MKVIASMMIAAVSAQLSPTGGFNANPASYGMSPGFGYGAGFGGFGGFGGGNMRVGPYGGGYGGYGRACRKGVTSDDLSGYARCYCDKNHRDEDFCNTGKVGSGDCQVYEEGTPGFTQEVIDALDDYYDEIFDEDCVERDHKNLLDNVRRCYKNTHSKDLPSDAACWCDANHKKNLDDLEDLDDCDRVLNLVIPVGPVMSPPVNDEFWVAMHYKWDEKDVERACESTTSSPSPAVYNAEDEGEDFDKFDPNCIERSLYGGPLYNSRRYPQGQMSNRNAPTHVAYSTPFGTAPQFNFGQQLPPGYSGPNWGR